MKTTPADYLAKRRIFHAKRLLGDSKLSIIQVALQVGFSSSQHFSTSFRKTEGMTPSEYRKASSSDSAGAKPRR